MVFSVHVYRHCPEPNALRALFLSTETYLRPWPAYFPFLGCKNKRSHTRRALADCFRKQYKAGDIAPVYVSKKACGRRKTTKLTIYCEYTIFEVM